MTRLLVRCVAVVGAASISAVAGSAAVTPRGWPARAGAWLRAPSWRLRSSSPTPPSRRPSRSCPERSRGAAGLSARTAWSRARCIGAPARRTRKVTRSASRCGCRARGTAASSTRPTAESMERVPTALGGGGPMPTTALQEGFAVISSDAGHSGPHDPSFGVDFQARLDYGYQAAAKLTPMAKALMPQPTASAPTARIRRLLEWRPTHLRRDDAHARGVRRFPGGCPRLPAAARGHRQPVWRQAIRDRRDDPRTSAPPSRLRSAPPCPHPYCGSATLSTAPTTG